MTEYHLPVLLNDCVDALVKNPDGIYVDATFGGGGHSKEILKRLNSKGRLIGIDKDIQTKNNIPDDPRLEWVHIDYRYLSNILAYKEIQAVDGILADLGVSSFQFNEGQRGFSIRFDADLDMRMNQEQEVSAKEIVNTYEEEELQRIFRKYGELKNYKKIASQIVLERGNKKIKTTFQLMEILKKFTPFREENKFFAQVFQALRIEVNDELSGLEEFLKHSLESLKKGGRLVIMSYHSLEDRIVKDFLNSQKTEVSQADEILFGRTGGKKFKQINNKVIVPTEKEIESNNRARSAKLRIAEKL